MKRLLNVGRSAQRYHYIPWHSHIYWEAIYYCRGTGVNTIGNNKIKFEEGSLIIVPPHVEHKEESLSGFENIYFHYFETENIEEGLLSKNNNVDLSLFFEMLCKSYFTKTKDWNEINFSVIDTIFDLGETEKQEISIPYVEYIRNKIDENYKDPSFHIQDCFNGDFTKYQYTRKIFVKEMGKPLIKYLTDKRIDYAKKLLLLKSKINIQINEIAKLSGFYDQFYFSRVFKKKTGMCPLKWADSMDTLN